MINPGAKLGPYEIVSQIGAGGMGEVYRAHDTRLNRDVALKVLPDVFARDSQRMARFEREAKLLASLNHPNIAAIYGLEESGPIHALVMELVEGPTLAERIRSGAIPVDEALPIARQIADAVEYAHDHNVIHRDLKPANIKVTADGAVKVLDFGLAKAMSEEIAEADMSNSPTLSMAATRQGMILGTAAYMSPEQAKGKQVDRRADVWAFGAVLFEILTSKQAFPGEDITEVLAAVVKSEPTWHALPAGTPPAIRTLLRRCLDKTLRHRLGHISEARILIEDVLSGAAPSAAEAGIAAPHGMSRERLAWAAAVFLISTVALLVWVVVLRQPPAEPQRVEFSFGPPENTSFNTGAPFLAISPDGSKVAFLGVAEAATQNRQLWVRALGSETAQPLAGTEGANEPFWSADSRFLAFHADGKLKKISISGGPAQTLAEVEFGGGVAGSWSREGVILFTPAAAPGTEARAIHRVPATGGTAVPVTQIDSSRQEVTHTSAFFLPDGNHFLYRARSSNPENHAVYVASLDSPEKKLLLNALSNVTYVPPGYLVFHREGTLMARPFDAQRLELTGEEVPIAEDVQFTGFGAAAFTTSQNGVLAYRTGTGAGGSSQLLWFDRSGKQVGALGEPGSYGGVWLSPDGERVSLDVPDGATRDIWIYDVARGLRTRFTHEPTSERQPIWSPDSSRIVINSNRKGRFDLYLRPASGAGPEEVLLEDNVAKYPMSWSADGRFLLYRANNDFFVLPLAGDRKPVPFLQTPFAEDQGKFSPDGRWVAYESNETERDEVYVVPFPGPGGKTLVSTGGGQYPKWSRDGTEIVYLAPDNKLMAAAVNGKGSAFEVGDVKPLFETRPVIGRGPPHNVTADGQRFLVNTALEEASSAPITVVVNWTARLNK